MISQTRMWVGALLGAVLLLAGTGCSNKLQQERDSLYMQNQQYDAQLKAAQRQAADARARAEAAERALAAAQQAPPPATAPAPTGLEGEGGVTVGKTAAGETQIEIAGDVLFDLGKATIKPAFKKTLDKVAGVLKTQYAGRTFRIEGHTDPLPVRRSGWDDNWDLGAGRARAVALYLIGQGVPKESLSIASYADNKLKSPTDYAQDRRVDIVVVK